TETCLCPPERTVLVTGEPDSIGRYHPSFLAQFRFVVTGRRDIHHPRILRMQQGQPWHVEKSFDELLAIEPMVKTRNICAISSDKAFTEGHKRRRAFIGALQGMLGDVVDVYGRGIRDFESKWDVLSMYRYAIVL